MQCPSVLKVAEDRGAACAQEVRGTREDIRLHSWLAEGPWGRTVLQLWKRKQGLSDSAVLCAGQRACV